MLKTAQNVDRAMKTFSDAGDNDTVFFNVRENPFRIYGLYKPETEPDFKRMPDNVALNANEGVAALYLNTAGGRVRFPQIPRTLQ